MRPVITTLSDPSDSHRAVLSPVDRVSEIVFGLIMALTFTGSLSVATAERAEVRDMLIGALGCNIAWGLVDAVMYVLIELTERGRAAERSQDGLARIALTGQDLRGAVGVFLLVFLTTLPVVAPFLLFTEAHRALRISNAVALVMLFLCGYYLGKHAGRRAWVGGFLMLAIGVVLVWATILLGG